MRDDGVDSVNKRGMQARVGAGEEHAHSGDDRQGRGVRDSIVELRRAVPEPKQGCPFDQAGQPVLVSEYLALDAFEQFLVEDLGGLVTAADYAELPGLDEGRQIVIRPTCDDLNA